jgi:hypothetical protein
MKNYDYLIGKKIKTVTVERKSSTKTFLMKSLDQTDSDTNNLLNIEPKLRVWFPNTIGTRDYIADRLNIYIDNNDIITLTS